MTVDCGEAMPPIDGAFWLAMPSQCWPEARFFQDAASALTYARHMKIGDDRPWFIGRTIASFKSAQAAQLYAEGRLQ